MEEIVLPETLIGLHEEDDLLVAATLKGLGVLVPLLGAEVVMGSQRKNVFSDSRPGLTASGLERARTSGSVSTEGAGLLRAPESPLPQQEAAGASEMPPAVMSKEERRELRRKEQERRRQQRKAQKEEREGGTYVHTYTQICMQFTEIVTEDTVCCILDAVYLITLSIQAYVQTCSHWIQTYLHSVTLMNLYMLATYVSQDVTSIVVCLSYVIHALFITGPKLLSTSHDVDSAQLEGRHDVMEPWDSPSGGHFDDEATEERTNSWQDELGQEQTEECEREGSDSEKERSVSDYDQSEDAAENASNDGWEDFDDWGDNNEAFGADTDELAAPLQTEDPPQPATCVSQNASNWTKHSTTSAPSVLEERRSTRQSTSSQSQSTLHSPSEAFDAWQTGTGRISQRDAERIERQSKFQLEPDYFADMAPQI